MARLFLLAVIATLAITSVNGARIDIINQCGDTITALATCCGGALVNSYVLGGRGGRQQIDVSGNWPAGVIWAFPGSGNSATGNAAKPQANLAEFTVGAADRNDYYDISNVDAYNLPMRISPTQIAPGPGPSGNHCGTIVCAIGDLTSGFCQGPNFLTGPPGRGCKNADGPRGSATDGTRAFKNRCPTSYSYSNDNGGTVFGCQTGSNYEVVFCPFGSTGPDSSLLQQVV